MLLNRSDFIDHRGNLLDCPPELIRSDAISYNLFVRAYHRREHPFAVNLCSVIDKQLYKLHIPHLPCLLQRRCRGEYNAPAN